jgi:predicted ester cyclase
MKVEVVALVADEDAIAFAYTFSGTQNGPLMGTDSHWAHRAGVRKMVERWGSSDQLGMLQRSAPRLLA